SQEPVRKVDKPEHKRGKLTRRQRSEATPKARDEVKARSKGVCERCHASRSAELAHIERRWRSVGKPTAIDFADLCVPCHRWADSCKEGREWLKQFGERLRLK